MKDPNVNVSPGQLTVGFCGLGIMGAPMARRIMRHGYSLRVYNRTRGKAQTLVSEGATLCPTPADAARAADILIVMVTDVPDVREIVVGPQGILQGMRRGAVVVNMSTVTPQSERELAVEVAGAGGRYLDAPVSGGDIGAHGGTLAIMVGGDEAALKQAQPVLRCMGQTITYCGSSGAGQVAKLCNQILVAANLAAVCEAMGFAQANGLDFQTLFQAVGGGAAASWQLANLGPRIAAKDYAPGFMIDLVIKDLQAVAQTADRSGTPVALCQQVQQWFIQAQRQGYGRLGTQALARIFEETQSHAFPQQDEPSVPAT